MYSTPLRYLLLIDSIFLGADSAGNRVDHHVALQRANSFVLDGFILEIGQFAGSENGDVVDVENGSDFLYRVLHISVGRMLPNFPAALLYFHVVLNFAGKAAQDLLLRRDPDLVGKHPRFALRLSFVLQHLADVRYRDTGITGYRVLVVSRSV